MTDLKVAVIGAGVIGRTHIETLSRVPGLILSAIADPVPAAADLAKSNDVPFFADPADLVAARIADAVVIASSTETHLSLGQFCLQAGLPVLMEKPLAGSLTDGEALAACVRDTGVALLVGHHRRHNPIIRAAKAAIDAGEIGDLVTATVTSVLSKPAAYFTGWRLQPGSGGPLLINVTHEIDLLRHFFGPVAQVSAVTSNARRGNAVEDTAAVILTFANGGIATITQTDAAAGPWAWDVTAGDNPARFPAHDAIAYAYAGTRAALSLPDLSVWRHPGTPDWTTEMTRTHLPYTPKDTYVAQLEHFGDVVRGVADPINPVTDGLETMRVVEAIRKSAAGGMSVTLDP